MMSDEDLDKLVDAEAIPPELEQQPSELALAYEAFLRYLRLGRKRSIRAVDE